MTKSYQAYKHDSFHIRRSFIVALAFTVLLWIIKLSEILLDLNLIQYGIYPTATEGLIGILWAPLIHGSVTHLLANTAPIVILGTALLYGYPRSARLVLPAIYFGGGILVWLFARSSYHIGASILTFGIMFFIFTIGALRWDKRAIALAMIVFFLYGGMVWGIFPGDPSISYESHLFGAIVGTLMAVLLKNHDAPLPEKKYDWEDENEDDNPGSDE